MLYCTKCGNSIAPGSQFCSACGSAVQQTNQPYTQPYYAPQPKAKLNSMVLAGFITGCASLLIDLWGLVGIAGLVLSIVGYNQIAGETENGKGLAIAGIVIGAFSALFGLLMLLFGWSILFW